MAGERRRLADAVKHHTRDRNRPPSEPAGKQMWPHECCYFANASQNSSKQ
jgi:hypothetical protein